MTNRNLAGTEVQGEIVKERQKERAQGFIRGQAEPFIMTPKSAK
jgi:hypothetical protein